MIQMARAKFILGGIWFGTFSVITVFLIFIVTSSSLFHGITKDVFSWYMPLIVPTLTLMVSVYAHDATTGSIQVGEINYFYFILTILMSLLYLLAIAFVVLLIPFNPGNISAKEVKDIMSISNIYLSPLQALSTALLVIFFKHKKGK